MRGRKLVGSASIFLHKLLGRKRIILRNNLDVLIVIPGDHAAKIKCLFGQLKNRRINFLLIIHNLTLKERLSLVINKIPFAQVDELVDIKIFLKGERISLGKAEAKIFKGRFDKNQNYKRARILLKKLSPKILLTTTDPDVKILPFIKVARQKNIKTITIQHGAYESPKEDNYKSEIVLAWGNYYITWFKEELDKKTISIHITGSPFFDQLKIEPLKYKSMAINKLKVLLLLTLYPSHEAYLNEEITKLIYYLSKIGVSEIHIRPHPWQKLDKNLFSRVGYTKIKKEVGSLDTSLKKSDIVITLNTTAGFNALIKGKPLVYWQLNKFDTLPFKQGGIPTATSAKEVTVKCLELSSGKLKIDNRKRRELLNDVFYKLDGKSGKRVADFLSNQLSE